MLALLRWISVRHLVTSPLRTLLTVCGVAVGVATLVGITSINRSVMGAFRSTIDTIAGKADLTVAGAQAGFDERVLDAVRDVPGVTHAAGTLSVIAPVQGKPGQSLFVMGIDFLDDGFFRNYESVDRDLGALADDLEFLNSTDRLLVSERFAQEQGLATGDTLELQTQQGAKPFVIHGLLKETGPIKAFGGSVAVMFFGSAQEAFGLGRVFDRVDVKVDPTADFDAVQAKVKAAVGPTLEVDRPERRGQSVETMVRSFQLGLNLGSGIALLVGIFLVYNTVSIGVVQRRREIGTLRALGATRRRIRFLFTLEAGVLGALGSLLGMPLGLLIGRLAISSVSESVSAIYVKVNVKDLTIGTYELALGLTLGVLGSVFAAMRPAWTASSVQPVEALRRDVAVGAGAVELRSWPTAMAGGLFALSIPAMWIPPPVENFALGGYLAIFLILMGMTLISPLLLRALNRPFQRPGEALFGISGRLAADNFARAPLRTAVPVSAMAIGVAMAITIAGFVGSFQASSQRWIDQAIPADLFVTSSSAVAGVQNQPMAAALGEELVAMDGVSTIDKVRILPHDALGLRIFVISLIPEVYARRGKPFIMAGALPTAEQRKQGYVTLSENLARRRELVPGSTFDVMTPTGNRTYTVAAVIVDYTSDQGSIIMGRELFIEHFGDDRVDSFHVYVDDPTQLPAVRAAITERFGKTYNLYVLSNAELRDEATSLIENAFSITYAMEFVAVLLALLGVINTLLAAVLDRTREIGLLRAVGASRGHIVRLFASEAFFIGLTGGVMGVAAGGLLGLIVTRVIGVQATGWAFEYVYPWTTSWQMLVAATLCAILAGLYPARRAASLDVVEALAYE